MHGENEKKKKKNNTGKNKQDKAGSLAHDIFCTPNMYVLPYIVTVVEISFTKNVERKKQE